MPAGIPTLANAKFMPGDSAKLVFDTKGNKVAMDKKPEILVKADVVLPANSVVQIMTGDGMSRIELPLDTSQSAGTPTVDECDFSHRVCKVLKEFHDVEVEYTAPQEQVKIHHNDLSLTKNGKPHKSFYTELNPVFYTGSATLKYRLNGVTREIKRGDKLFVQGDAESRSGAALSSTKGVDKAFYKVAVRARENLQVMWKSQRHVSEKYALKDA